MLKGLYESVHFSGTELLIQWFFNICFIDLECTDCNETNELPGFLLDFHVLKPPQMSEVPNPAEPEPNR